MTVSRTLALSLLFAGISILAAIFLLLLPTLISYLGPQVSGVYTLPAWYWREHPLMVTEQVMSIAVPLVLGIASTIAGIMLSKNGKSLTANLQ